MNPIFSFKTVVGCAERNCTGGGVGGRETKDRTVRVGASEPRSEDYNNSCGQTFPEPSTTGETNLTRRGSISVPRE